MVNKKVAVFNIEVYIGLHRTHRTKVNMNLSMKVSDENKIGKGRTYKIYSLKVGFNKIIAQLENQQKKAVNETQENIERLRNLGK